MSSILRVLTLAVICAVPALSADLNATSNMEFLVVGDWGGRPASPFTTTIELLVAKAMNEVAIARNTQFQLALGDNFYLAGVDNPTDQRFLQTFEDVFNGDGLQTNWYVLAGNHDWIKSVQAQIQYTKRSNRWNFPDYYYTKTFTTPDGASVDVIMLDTIILCGQLWSDFSSVDDYDILDEKETQVAWAWAKRALEASTADYLIVAGHYPMYSASSHGPTQCLIEHLLPMFQANGVSVYLCGHDHNLQHIKDSQINYFVVGAGNFANNNTGHASDLPEDSLQFFNGDDVGGFAHVSVNATSMAVTLISGVNEELHYAEILPRDPEFRK